MKACRSNRKRNGTEEKKGERKSRVHSRSNRKENGTEEKRREWKSRVQNTSKKKRRVSPKLK
jgi:hypothetical protein